MSLVGRWRIIEMPDYDADYPDMMGLAFIQLKATARSNCEPMAPLMAAFASGPTTK